MSRSVVNSPCRTLKEDPLLHRYVSDLQIGDVLGPLDGALTPFMIREYAHAVEDASERHIGATDLVAPATIFHGFKGRLFQHACPEGPGPMALLHLVYRGNHHRSLPPSRDLTIVGEVTGREERRGRESLVIHFEVRDKVTGNLYTSYDDTTLLSYRRINERT
jgi:hypothetical protein